MKSADGPELRECGEIFSKECSLHDVRRESLNEVALAIEEPSAEHATESRGFENEGELSGRIREPSCIGRHLNDGVQHHAIPSDDLLADTGLKF